jgi:peptidoglycan/xylan/chitin deacetylase (PgdA/CDA1 family)
VNVRRALNGAIAFLLLPLSLIPLYFAIPRLRGEQDAVAQGRRPLDAPKVEPTKAEVGAWRKVSAFRGAVPVLAYHGVNELGDHYSVSQAEFAKQMEMLSRAGFQTVSIAQYARFLSGDSGYLPDRPILITFDDGRLDSYRGADKVLAEQGFRATMFVIAGAVEQSSPFYLNWDELRRMAQSGRWDVQEHAGVGHVNVRYDKAGHKGPAYSHRRYLDNGGIESFADYKQRVAGDVLWAKQTLSERIPGFTPWAFAVPFGDYGQNSTNDPRIAPFLDRFLGRQFRAVFLTWPPDYSTAGDDHSRLPRIELHQDTGAMRLYRWLRDRIPTAAKTHKAPGKG